MVRHILHGTSLMLISIVGTLAFSTIMAKHVIKNKIQRSVLIARHKIEIEERTRDR